MPAARQAWKIWSGCYNVLSMRDQTISIHIKGKLYIQIDIYGSYKTQHADGADVQKNPQNADGGDGFRQIQSRFQSSFFENYLLFISDYCMHSILTNLDATGSHVANIDRLKEMTNSFVKTKRILSIALQPELIN